MQNLSNLNYLLVTTTCLVSIASAIRVDWNTNTGPIIPPTPRTTIRPVPPFREPAPVWEDLSNDIPNPNPYVYVPPPPSRPRQHLNTNVNYNSNVNYGSIITPQNSQTYYQQQNNNVASLSPQYIPNVGTRYVAVVPKSSTTTKFPLSSPNSLSPDDKNSYKLHGKYNAKTKKYKAYEKVKYVPLNYYPLFKEDDSTSEASSMNTKPYVPEGKPMWMKGYQQDLPYEKSPVKFNSGSKWSTTTTKTTPTASTTKSSTTKSSITKSSTSSSTTTTTTTHKPSLPITNKSYTKHVYAKDALVKPKEKFSKSVDKAKKS